MILKVIDFLRRIQNKIYSVVISKSLKSVGAHFNIEYPCRITGAKFLTVGSGFVSFLRLRIDAHESYKGQKFMPVIKIGDNVLINSDCHIGCINKIEIGNDVLIASKVFITDHFHGRIEVDSLLQVPAERPLYSKGPVIIEDSVWIGEGVVIMPGDTIGRNSIIGANAVVTKSFPGNSVIGGNPAKLLKSLL